MSLHDFPFIWEYLTYISTDNESPDQYINCKTLNSSNPGAYVQIAGADK